MSSTGRVSGWTAAGVSGSGVTSRSKAIFSTSSMDSTKLSFISFLITSGMRVGLVDAEEGCSAVSLAAGNNQADAEDRNVHERIKDNRPKPNGAYVAWRWVTKPG